MLKKIISRLIALLVVCQVLTILLSWIITALWPSMELHSLLSSAGVRWGFRTFSRNISGEPLAWIILISMTTGATYESGILRLFKKGINHDYNWLLTIRTLTVELVVTVIVLSLLSVIPHAILLNIYGNLIPSYFTQSIIPIVSLTVCFLSLSCALTLGQLHSISEAVDLLCIGIRKAAPLYIVYMLAAELLASIYFVLGFSVG